MVMSYIDIIEVILSDLRDICAWLVENLLKCRILQNLALQGLQNIQKLTEICACGVEVNAKSLPGSVLSIDD